MKIAVHIGRIPECPEKRALILRCRKYLDGRTQRFKDEIADAVWEAFSEVIPEGLPEAFGQGCRHPSRKPEPEQEPEQETSPPAPSSAPISKAPTEPGWPSPEALVALYNAAAPPGHPQVTKLSEGRRRKARQYLAQFPNQDFWQSAFAEIPRSRLLRGLANGPGHESFRADFDWLLTKGKDGTENVVKVSEGKYRDRAAQADEDDE